MDPPRLQFAKTTDDVSVAYFRVGTGLPIVFGSSIFGDAHQYAMPHPHTRLMTDRLVALGWSVVRYDLRGMGSSDHDVADFSLEARLLDLEAVVSALRLEHFALGGVDSGANLAIAYALRHPSQVSQLVLMNGWASGPDRLVVNSAARATASISAALQEDWSYFTLATANIATDHKNPAHAQDLARNMNTSTTAENYAALRESWARTDLTGLLVNIAAPSLVIHDRNHPFSSFELCQQLATRIPDARFVVIDGDGDAEIATIDEFLRATTASKQPRTDVLSSREIDVLRLIAAGRTNHQIADELVITHNTVQRHVSNILDKTGLVNRTEAAIYARDHGLA